MTHKRLVDLSIVQLDLWDALGVAEDVPEEADLAGIWTSLDLALEALSVREQLTLAGDAIARLAQIIQNRAWLTISELDQLGNVEGPVMPLGAFDRFVRQSMQMKFEAFVEAPPVPPRLFQGVTQAEFPDDGRSVVVELDPVALLEALDAELEFDELATYEQALSLAYSEDIHEWTSAIAQYFEGHSDQSIPFTSLAMAMNVVSEEEAKEPQASWVQTWLALLLGGYKLEQRGKFYQAETIWITRY